eukprot:m.39949 g.39949  ORF g.39949 m.39949 type:complete len:329 (+) comp18344_c0_seq2:177-1163(+)
MASTEETKSSEDNIKWLRDHGVEVETPEDRIAKKVAAASARTLKVGDPGTRTFQYVLIPAGMTDPLQELTAIVHVDRKGKGDALPDILATAFSSGAVDSEALKHTTVSQLSQENGPMDMSKLTPEMLTRAGGEAETFKLSNQISLYLDAVGALKHLAINPRAADLASRCGYGSGVSFHGDIYVGRQEGTPGSAKNIDFHIDEVSPSSAWILGAFNENMQRQATEGRPGIDAEELSTRGGQAEGYSWTQDPSDIEVLVPAPKGTKGKQVSVKFTSTHVTVKIDGGFETSLKLYMKVAADGCSWSLADGSVVITLEKASEGETWPSLIRD